MLVRELIRNLVDNALQYTPRGGTVTVRVLADPFGQVVVLQVEDNGPGIPEAERELVFQPFYRALGTEVDGSGLGLAIVREIAEQHGGSVDIETAHPRSQPPARGSRCASGSAGLARRQIAASPRCPGQRRAPRRLRVVSSASGAGSSRSTSGCRAPGRA